MSDREEQIIRAEAALLQEEKKFLMEKYVSMLLLQVNEDDAANGEAGDLDDKTVESLLVARPYVSGDVAQQIADLLSAKGHEFEEEEEEDGFDNNGDGSPEAEEGEFADGDDSQVEGLFDDEEAGADDPEAMAASLELNEETLEQSDKGEPADVESVEVESVDAMSEHEGDAEGLFDEQDTDSDSPDGGLAIDEADGNADEDVEGLFDDEDETIADETDGADDENEEAGCCSKMTSTRATREAVPESKTTRLMKQRKHPASLLPKDTK